MAMVNPILGHFTGRIGANIFQAGKYGDVVRYCGRAKQAGTRVQNTGRNGFSRLSNVWKMMSSADRDVWKVWAGTNPCPPHGQSGQDLFVKLNTWRTAADQALLTLPPSDFAGDEVTACQYNNAAFWKPASMIVTLLPIVISAKQKLFVYATAPHTRLMDGAQWAKALRFIGYTSAPGAATLDIAVQYAARFGAPYQGQYVGVWLKLYTFKTALNTEGSYLSLGSGQTRAGGFNMEPLDAP